MSLLGDIKYFFSKHWKTIAAVTTVLLLAAAAGTAFFFFAAPVVLAMPAIAGTVILGYSLANLSLLAGSLILSAIVAIGTAIITGTLLSAFSRLSRLVKRLDKRLEAETSLENENSNSIGYAYRALQQEIATKEEIPESFDSFIARLLPSSSTAVGEDEENKQKGGVYAVIAVPVFGVKIALFRWKGFLTFAEFHLKRHYKLVGGAILAVALAVPVAAVVLNFFPTILAALPIAGYTIAGYTLASLPPLGAALLSGAVTATLAFAGLTMLNGFRLLLNKVEATIGLTKAQRREEKMREQGNSLTGKVLTAVLSSLAWNLDKEPISDGYTVKDKDNSAKQTTTRILQEINEAGPQNLVIGGQLISFTTQDSRAHCINKHLSPLLEAASLNAVQYERMRVNLTAAEERATQAEERYHAASEELSRLRSNLEHGDERDEDIHERVDDPNTVPHSAH